MSDGPSTGDEATFPVADGGEAAAPPRMYADRVFVNGTVITVDDDEINDDPGTIAEAIAVRDGAIVDVGDGEMDYWVGPDTEVIDLAGETVIPGIVDSHSHLYEFGARMMGKAVYPDIFDRQRVLLDEDYTAPEQIRDDMLEAIERKVEELDEGEFILVRTVNPILHSHLPEDITAFSSVEPDPDDDRYSDVFRDVSRDSPSFVHGKTVFEEDMITKADIDELAPDHPLLVMSFPYFQPNERAFEWYEEQYGERPIGDEAVDLFRVLLHDVFLDGDPELVAEMIKACQEVYLRNGVTTYGTHVYPMTPLDAYSLLDRRDEVRPRLSWGTCNLYVLNPEMDKYHKRITQSHGTGSDFMWNGGVSLAAMDAGAPRIATTLDAPDEVKSRELHDWVEKGSPRRGALEMIAERGARFASSNHILGDRAVDKVIEAILEGSRRGGLSDDDIRERMHGFDHGGLYPRPDQVEVCKRYNFRLNLCVYEPWRIKFVDRALEPYPEEEQDKAERWFAAAKTALDNGLKVGWHGKELENPFPYIAAFVTRVFRGDEVAPEQAIDRVKALKMATTWNAEYLLRDDLGSIEVGNRADFVVIDANYLEVSADELKDITPLMTVLDGEVLYRNEAFAA